MSIIAITGATGFVGREFVRQVEKKNLSPRLLVRSPEKLNDLSHHAKVIGDLHNASALRKLCKGADVLVHIAGRITARNAEEFRQANVVGTENLTKIAVKAGVKRIILVSSLAAREPELTDYAASKRAGEDALIEHAAGVPYVILRPPAVYGPGDEGTFPLLKALTQRLAIVPGQKHSRISVIQVSDLAAALVNMLCAPLKEISGQTYELHDGRKNGYSWEEMAHISGLVEKKAIECIFLPKSVITVIAGISVLYARLFGKVPALSFDKVKELYHEDWICRHNLLGQTGLWKAEMDFREGFKQTVKWYRVNGWLS